MATPVNAKPITLVRSTSKFCGKGTGIMYSRLDKIKASTPITIR